MSECVVWMEMPKGCLDCPCVNGEYGYCQADKEERQIGDPDGRPSWCPIICSLPEGHGRLVDADALDAAISDEIDESKWDNAGFTGYRVWSKVDEAPTIVPEEAERSET